MHNVTCLIYHLKYNILYLIKHKWFKIFDMIYMIHIYIYIYLYTNHHVPYHFPRCISLSFYITVTTLPWHLTARQARRFISAAQPHEENGWEIDIWGDDMGHDHIYIYIHIYIYRIKYVMMIVDIYIYLYLYQ